MKYFGPAVDARAGLKLHPGLNSLLGLLGLLCLLRLFSLLRFLSHSILIGFNGWKRDTRLARGGLSLATASIVIRTDSEATASRCHAAVIALSTVVIRFRRLFRRAIDSAAPRHG